LITVQNLDAACYTECCEVTKIWGAGAPPHGIWIVSDHPGMGVADPYKHASPHTCCSAECGHSRSNGTSVITQIRRKNLSPRVPAFRVMKPEPVIGTETDLWLWSYDLWSEPSYLWLSSTKWSVVTMGLSHTVSGKKRWFRSKFTNFPTIVNLTPTLSVFPLEFCKAGSAKKKPRITPVPDLGKLWRYVHSFSYNTATWRTDWQTEMVKQHRAPSRSACYCMLIGAI